MMTVIRRTVRLIGVVAGLAAPTVLPAAGLETAVNPPALILARTGQISTYDQAGKLIDHKGSGQDGEFQRGAEWPDPRFIINSDGTVSDALTGLMWFKDGNCFGKLPWPSARQSVAEFNQGNVFCQDLKTQYHDWSLPSVGQLATLLDAQAGVESEFLRLGGFTGVQEGVYWSSTPYQGQLNAWGVDFAKGQILPQDKLDGHFLLMVRQEATGKGTASEAGGPPLPPESKGGGQKTLAPPSQRYIDNGDGTVTDTLTGLMWLQVGTCLSGLDWQGALAAAKRMNGGEKGAGCPSLKRQYTDWSLPNMIELRSLIDYDADYPALSPGHPFKDMADGYWTATTVAPAPGQAFLVNVDTGATLAEPKTGRHRAILVRQATPPPERPRKEADKGSHLSVAAKYVLVMDPEMTSEIQWPPLPRFVDNGDGTSMDTVTGVNWLTDAGCLGKKKWSEVVSVFKMFNSQKANPLRATFHCAGYEDGFDDWELPTLSEMRELINKEGKLPELGSKGVKPPRLSIKEAMLRELAKPSASDNKEANKEEWDGALWLNQQGVKNVQGGGAYWTASVTPLNLYYADALSLKTGKAGVYPKSFDFYIWPKRRLTEEEKLNEPLLSLTANAIDGMITLSPKDPISLVVSLHTFGLRTPSDFWLWYDTPGENRLWLTSIRTWTDKTTPLYQGPLFNLPNYEVYRSVANGLSPGVYDFHFAVDTTPNGALDGPRFEGGMQVIIPGEPE